MLFSELFVNNLAGSTTEEALKALFTPYGIVESCWVTEKKGNAFGVVRCGRRPRCTPAAATRCSHPPASAGLTRRGPCCARFETNAEAVSAKKALHQHKLENGRVIGVKW